MLFKKALLVLIIVFLYSCNLSNKKVDHPVITNRIVDSAKTLIDNKHTNQAFHYLDSSFNAIKDPGIGDQFERLNFRSQTYYRLSYVYDNKALLKKADLYTDSSIYLIENSKKTTFYWQQLSKSYLIKGDLLTSKGRYNLSYQWFFKAKQLGDKFAAPYDKSEFNSRLAFLNYNQKRYQVAASYYVAQYNDLKKCKPNFDIFSRIQGALDNAGICYANSLSLDSAKFYYDKAIEYVNDNETKYAEHKSFIAEARAVIYNNLGNLYRSLFDYKKALESYKKSIYLYNNLTVVEGLRGSELELAKLYLKMANYSGCNKILNKYESGIDTLKFDNDKPIWYELKIDYLYRTKQLKGISKYLKEYSTIKSYFDKEFRNASYDNIDKKFNDLQKEYELSLLKKENQLNTLYLIIALVFSVMAMFILYQLWRNIKISKKNNANLTLLNKQTTEQNLHLQKTLYALEQSQEENKRVMKIVAHDLRSPISAIVSLAGFLIAEDRFNKEDKHLISLIKNSGSDSLNFVNELLNKDYLQQDLEKESVDLNALLNYCVNLLQYKATEKQQIIILKSVPLTFNLNREKIWRVISNLITNAIKFSPKRAKIEVEMDLTLDTVLISVRDHGIGIPESMQENIFTITEETMRQGTDGEKSYGMGLIISKQIVEAHGGSLWFESSETTGTTFYAQLPIK